jgi:HD superfamily phosphodiesterase
MSQLESLANSFPGVLNTYALQAGREMRIIVEHAKVDDARAEQMALDIARKIQENVHYPGHCAAVSGGGFCEVIFFLNIWFFKLYSL